MLLVSLKMKNNVNYSYLLWFVKYFIYFPLVISILIYMLCKIILIYFKIHFKKHIYLISLLNIDIVFDHSSLGRNLFKVYYPF